jgi:mRNA interferase RelE/StbE
VKRLFRESFAVDLSALNDDALLRRIENVSEQVEAASSFQHIFNLKRLETKGKYYRIRIGDYRLGFIFEKGAVPFIRCLNRKEIYRYFPWTVRP